MSKMPPKYQWNRVPTCQRPYKPYAVENVSSRTVPVSGLECSYGRNFQLGYRDLGNRVSYENIEILNLVKKRMARRDLGNRARPTQTQGAHLFLIQNVVQQADKSLSSG